MENEGMGDHLGKMWRLGGRLVLNWEAEESAK